MDSAVKSSIEDEIRRMGKKPTTVDEYRRIAYVVGIPETQVNLDAIAGISRKVDLKKRFRRTMPINIGTQRVFDPHEPSPRRAPAPVSFEPRDPLWVGSMMTGNRSVCP